MIKELQKKEGFVMLFAVTISAILLTIALGITSIALKEIKFSTNARYTNDAFFAADTGIECAFMNDKSSSTIFISSPSGTMSCAGNNVSVTKNNLSSIWTFTITNLGSQSQSCANVTVDKSTPNTVVIISNGHNDNLNSNCTLGPNTVERQIKSTYGV